jgi:chemotaxis methyl-accepting protein methylase
LHVPPMIVPVTASGQPPSGGDAAAEALQEVEAILERIRVAGRFDFAPLGPTAVGRRVKRRMRLLGVASVAEYLDLLGRSRAEIVALRTELLGNGTVFFREPRVWQFIESHVVPSIVERSDPARPVRIWVPQCGAGSDAYLLAMLLLEETAARGRPTSVQVFASDVDEAVLGVARAGRYPWIVAEAVGTARLRRFFVQGRQGCQVTRELRHSVVFARHDLFSDPPFSHLDMVCCRNVLRYLDLDARGAALNLLHRVLNRDGYLVLGMNEGVRTIAALQPVSGHWSVYRRVDGRPAAAIASDDVGHGVVVPPPSPAAPARGVAVWTDALGSRAAARVRDDLDGNGELARLLRLIEIGRLAAGLAHEVSQPLGAVANVLEALAVHLRAGSSADPALLDLVGQGISQSERARRIVVHIVRLLRNGERTTEPCDVRNLVADAADLVRPTIREHRIALQVVSDPLPCRVQACRVEIEQVVVNLLQNAIDAAVLGGDGPRQIIVETRLTAGGQVKVRVQDSGAGISAELADRMFEPFFTTKPDGFGMGLAISRSIVDDHGGCIWVEQKLGEEGGGVMFILPPVG